MWGFPSHRVPLAIGDRVRFFVRSSQLKIGAAWIGAAVAHYTIAAPSAASEFVFGPYSFNEHDPRVVDPKKYPWVVNFDLESGCNYLGLPKQIRPNAPTLNLRVVTECVPEEDFRLLIRQCT